MGYSIEDLLDAANQSEAQGDSSGLIHDAIGDAVHVIWDRRSHFSEPINKFVTLYRECETRELVGISLTRVSLLFEWLRDELGSTPEEPKLARLLELARAALDADPVPSDTIAQTYTPIPLPDAAPKRLPRELVRQIEPAA